MISQPITQTANDTGADGAHDIAQPPLPPRPQTSENRQAQTYIQQQTQQQYVPQPYIPQQYTAPDQPYPQFDPPPTRPFSTSNSLRPGLTSSQPDSHFPTATSSSKPNTRERIYQWSIRVGVPVNRLTNKLGSEAFWPSSLDHESDKAARILMSFCQDGFYTAEPTVPSGPPADTLSAGYTAGTPPLPPRPGPQGRPKKAIVKIPPAVVRQAAGLAIFTTFRTGLHVSGAGGSGVIVARLPDGGWSPPSGFLVHTLGAGLLVGLDIYDCVCVLRTPQAVEAFTKPRVSLGGEVGLVAGPVVAGGSVEAAVLAKSASMTPVWSYMKSRGFYAGVQADGTVIVGRPDANAEFYNQRGITAQQILRGQVPPPSYSSTGSNTIPPWPVATRKLMEALKAAEGRTDVDSAVMREVSVGPTPGDLSMSDAELGNEASMSEILTGR
ncbi:hypothetical protein SEPCBS57363_001751 [Sporothrix epigloea]|uniref:Ysc84 actin-binding domain-containing protein n=1 Tax=Sporothrix epigloea TaxID=1892477 RepID=A0ABP0DC20_9PEZI